MATDRLRFEWLVHESGYRWLMVGTDGQTQWQPPEADHFRIDGYLDRVKAWHASADSEDGIAPGYYVAANCDIALARRRFSEPFQEKPSPFLEFANISLTADAIIDFANTWGFLGNYDNILYITLSPKRGRSGLIKPGIRVEAEPAWSWVMPILLMREQFKLWKMLHDNDEAELENWARKSIEYLSQLPFEERGEVPDLTTPQRVVDYVREELEQQVNMSIIEGNIKSHIVWNKQHNKWQLELASVSLIDALRFQFASKLCTGIGLRRCKVCEKWMEILPSLGRTDKKYCSNACRMKAHRQRKAGQR